MPDLSVFNAIGVVVILCELLYMLPVIRRVDRSIREMKHISAAVSVENRVEPRATFVDAAPEQMVARQIVADDIRQERRIEETP